MIVRRSLLVAAIAAFPGLAIADTGALATEDTASAAPQVDSMPWYIPRPDETYVAKKKAGPRPGMFVASSITMSGLSSEYVFDAGDTLTGSTQLLGYFGWRTFGFEGGINLVKTWPVLGIAVNRYSGYSVWRDEQLRLRAYVLMPSAFLRGSGNFTTRGAHEVGVDLTGARLQIACNFFVELRVPSVEAWVLIDGNGASIVRGVGMSFSAGAFR